MLPLPPALQEALDSGALILTPTALSAASLRAAHDALQRAAGHNAWQPANVLSWQQWLGGLWPGLILYGHETRLLLNPVQEESLWRDIVRASLDAANLASASGYATLAQSAFDLAASYGITSQLTRAARTEDTAQFARWADEFTRTCGRHGYLPATRLPDALGEHLTRGTFTPPAEIHLAGFLDRTPADDALQDALRRAGTRIVEHPQAPGTPVTRHVLHSGTEIQEVRAAARWLRDFLDRHIAEHPGSELPAVHIVLANPSFDRGTLDSAFREALAPELDSIEADPGSAPWEHAAGRPLASEPLISTLVLLLRGVVRPLLPNEVTALLLSPFLGPRRDHDAAAQFDAYSLRDRPPLRPERTFRDLHRAAQNSPFGETILGWLNPLLAVLHEAADLNSPRSHAAWTTFVRDLASAVNWPGTQPPAPTELAALTAWEHLLDRVATLDFTGRRVPFGEALAALEHQLSSATVAPLTQAPIRILTANEAAATGADVLLLLQATDAHWPPAARPHPLLPWHLQASAAMPGAHPARDLAHLQRLTEALLGSTPHVLVSYAAESDGASQRLAPALERLVDGEAWKQLQAADLLPPLSPEVVLEQFVDDSPLPPLPSPRVPGGATVLQLQAACGFRAFAEIRLQSTEPRVSDLGIDAGRAGSLLHGALEAFWGKVRSRSTLR